MKKIFCLVIALCLFSATAHATVALNGSFAALIEENSGNAIVAPYTYSAIVKLKDGLFAACSQENGKYALMNEKGEILTDFAYGEFIMLSNGIQFSKDGKYGVMNDEFAIIVPCEYTWLIENGEGGYLALRTDVWDDMPDGVYMIDETGYVSPTGVKVASFLIDMDSGLSPALSTDNGRYGYLNSEGQWEIRPQYAYADEFANGAAVASLDSGSGVIDDRGRWLITPKYDFINIMSGENGIAAAVSYEDGVTVFSTENYEKIFSLDGACYGAYVSFGGASVIAYMDERVVQIGKDGKEILSLDAQSYIFPVDEERSIVYDGTGAYLTDVGGNRILSGYSGLDFLCEHEGKRYYLYTKGESMCVGVTDEMGKVVLDAVYDHISVPQNGYLTAENAQGATLFKTDGSIVWQYEY